MEMQNELINKLEKQVYEKLGPGVAIAFANKKKHYLSSQMSVNTSEPCNQP